MRRTRSIHLTLLPLLASASLARAQVAGEVPDPQRCEAAAPYFVPGFIEGQDFALPYRDGECVVARGGFGYYFWVGG